MARYRIHRIKETPKETFRWSAHTGGLAIVKPKDYDADIDVEAASPYSAWRQLRGSEPLFAGDLLEALPADGSAGSLQIVKFTGFEPAKWFVPEAKAETSLPVSSPSTQPEAQST
jgi:hypothetical protein